MLLPSVRRLALADVDEDVLRDLVEHGESIHVERKRQPPEPPGLGAAAASFANMLGGFILLGVDDKGGVVGWSKPPKLDLQSHLGELLRREVDPLPPFVAEMRELDGKPVGVLRVFESADRPHIVRGTGAIYVRTSKGKEPIPVDDHQTVLAMARRGEDAAEAARARLRETPAVKHTFMAPDSGIPQNHQGIEVLARAAPLTVTPAHSDWALTRVAAELCSAAAERLVPRFLPGEFDYGRSGPDLRPQGRAISAVVFQEKGGGSQDRAIVLADSNGTVAASILRGGQDGDPPFLLLDRMLDEELVPLAQTVTSLLRNAEAFGRAAVDLWIVFAHGGRLHGGHRHAGGHIHVAREITIPADDDEVLDLAEQWHREVQREAGIVKFEGKPGS